MSTNTETDRRPSERVDVCVVGAGVAGGMTAYSLAKRGYDVVLLEAGPWFEKISAEERLERAIRPEFDRTEVWAGGIDPDRDRFTDSAPDRMSVELNRQRLKGIGGTTQHWAASVGRLHEKDFNMQSRYGLAADWPIDYEDLQPYYAEAESEMGVSGGGDNPFVPRDQSPPMDPHPHSYADELFQAACESLDITTHSNALAINSETRDGRTQCMGYGTCTPFCPSGAKYTGDIHVRKAIEEGTRVIDRVPVQRLEHDQSGANVEAVVYRTPDGSEYRQTARQFVLACGGIETPRLLLLSQSEQYPDGLANSSGAVGRYLFFTPFVSVIGQVDEPTNQEPIGFGTLVSDQFYEHEGPRPGSVHLRFDNHGPDQPVDQALGGGFMEPVTGSAWGDELAAGLEDASENRSVKIGANTEMLPRAENRVSLNHDETDTYGNPVPDIAVDFGQHAFRTGEYAVSIITDILAEMGAEITSDASPGTQQLGQHHKGTTRMGADPDESVVNARLRTHDLNNLWITSSSVFTTGGAINPTLTIGALSLKAADHIDEAL